MFRHQHAESTAERRANLSGPPFDPSSSTEPTAAQWQAHATRDAATATAAFHSWLGLERGRTCIAAPASDAQIEASYAAYQKRLDEFGHPSVCTMCGCLALVDAVASDMPPEWHRVASLRDAVGLSPHECDDYNAADTLARESQCVVSGRQLAELAALERPPTAPPTDLDATVDFVHDDELLAIRREGIFYSALPSAAGEQWAWIALVCARCSGELSAFRRAKAVQEAVVAAGTLIKHDIALASTDIAP